MAKKNKRNDSYLSIRKKLIAAVAMLLVASFMVASSSYAWFTLSTAPEITGIQTSVGANGNLEIALWDGTHEPGSAVGDSLLEDLKKNLTWGNLVNLQNEAYGLSAITLRPARLDVTTGTLLTPVYGADGRIEKLNNGSTQGVYVLSENAFKAPTVDGNRPATGVYGIGNSTAMTQQQIDYRAGFATAASSINTAQTYAKNSLTAAGSEIASYAAQHATKEGTDNGPYDLTKLGTLIGLLKQSSQQLDNAMIAIATAVYAKQEESATNYKTNGYDTDPTALTVNDAYTYLNGVTDSELLPTTLKEKLAAFEEKRLAVATAVAHAEANFEALGDAKTTATWAQFQSVVMDTNTAEAERAPLVIIDDILINDHGIDTITSSDTISALVQDIMAGKGITASLPVDSGVYSDIAELTGNYTVKILLSGVSYGELKLDNTPASMTTAVGTVVNYKDGFPAAPVGTANDPVINDLYGYRIDMAFRTNATDSNLLLQTEGVGRIYSTGATNTTMGSGSTMSFETLAEGFDANDMRGLMKAIRLVFAEGTSVLAVAAIDTAVDDLDVGDALELPIKILDKDYYRFDDEYGFQFLKDESTPATKAEIVDGTYTIKFAADNAITALDANTAEKISVYVYLDGDYVENSDVAATAAQSMFGNLNLQFSSSASLVPMEYAPLQAGDNMGGETQQPSEPSEP